MNNWDNDKEDELHLQYYQLRLQRVPFSQLTFLIALQYIGTRCKYIVNEKSNL